MCAKWHGRVIMIKLTNGLMHTFSSSLSNLNRPITFGTISVTSKYMPANTEKKTSLNEPRREKTGFFICENKDADQLRGNREADQRLCFRYTDSTIPLLSKSEISSL